MIPYRDCIVFLLANALKHAQATTRKHLCSLGLPPVQCLLLNALLEEEGLSVGEIGKRVGLDTLGTGFERWQSHQELMLPSVFG